MALQNKTLKQGQFTSPQSKGNLIDRYIIENTEDLKAFAKVFKSIKDKPFKMYDNFQTCINEGRIILVTDPNPIHGFPTYCFESKETDTPHPTNIYRYEK